MFFTSPNPLGVPEIAFNSDFETGDYTPMWTLTGGNAHTTLVVFQTVYGVPSLCLKRMPGKPNDNGGIEQQVLLVKDVLYQFTANIAAVESG